MTADTQYRNEYEIDDDAMEQEGDDDAYASYRSISKAAVIIDRACLYWG